MSGAERRVILILNHSASSRSLVGGSRHVDLFARLPGWDFRIIAAKHERSTREPVGANGRFETVLVPRHASNGPARVLSWTVYTAQAFVRGLMTRRLGVVWGSSPHMGAAVAGLAVARLRRRPFVLEIRDLWPRVLLDIGMLTESSLVYRLLRRLERFLYRSADRIVVVADGMTEHIVDEGVDGSKIWLIPNGAEPSDFVVEDDADVLRKRLSLDGLVVTYAGAHGPANGLDFVVDAAAELETELPDVRFVLVGRGLAKAALADDVARRGLKNLELRDPIPKSEIPELLAASDIGLHCLADVKLFQEGGSPNKLHEYMAAGLPVVTNTAGEVTEMVEAANCGVATAPDRLADGVRRLAGLDPDTRSELGRNGRRWIEAHRSRRVLAEKLQLLLDEVESASGRRRLGR